MEDLNKEESIKEHVNEMSKIRDTLFPCVDENIKHAQEKQQRQYKMKRGQPVCPFRVGDQVLQRNMLQKTKAGYKFEDQWLGPYHITYINVNKGTCRLANKSGKKLTKLVSVKHIKPYRLPTNNEPGSTCSEPTSISADAPPVPKTRKKVPAQTPPVPK